MESLNWLELFRSLGASLLEVLKAEVEAFKEELAVSGRHLGVGLGLLGGAVMILFWTVGALIFAVGAVLAIWLKTWAAALVVVAGFLLVALGLIGFGLRQLRRVENPLERFKDRLDDHLDWWQNALLHEEKQVGAARPEEEDLP